MPDYLYFPNLNAQVPDLPQGSIVSRTFHQDKQLKAILFGFAAGQELSEHTASVPAIIHILEGEATLTLGPDRFEASPGAWAHMPPGMPHSIYAKTPVRMLLIMLSKPD